MEQHRQIVESWVKLEKCLNDFDADVSKKQSKRPMSSAPAPNKFQINKKRPESSFKIGALKNRPMTSSGQNPRPFSSATQIRPGTALTGMAGAKSSINQTFNFSKAINSLGLEEVLALYEARCKDNQVDYLESQAKFFIDKFKVSCVDNVFNFIEHNAGVISAKLISEVLEHNSYFSKLELGKNNLGDEGLGWIARLVARNPNIIHLDVSSNSITEEGVQILVESLAHNNTLISLCLKSFEGMNRNKVGPKGCKHIKKLLQGTQTLMYLDLCASQIGILGLKSVCEGLKANSSLLGLDISNNYLGPNATKHFTATLSSSNLQELNLANNNLTNLGVQTLAPLLSRLSKSQIRKLNLTHNDLTSAALPKLCESLQTNPNLEELVLDQNNFSAVQVASLKGLLMESESLKLLSLERCFMDEFGAEALKHGLTHNTSLVTLNLKSNSLYDTGFVFLCEGLSANSKLKVLEVADNRLRDKSGTAFGGLLKKNMVLEEVGMSNNALAETGGAAIVEGLLNNKVMKRIRLRLNPIGYKYMQDIEKLLEMNTKSQKRDFKPNIEGKIKELQIFETKRDSVFLEMERLEEQLAQKKVELEHTKRQTQAAKDKETAVTKDYERQVEEAITYFNKLEEESHNIGKRNNEFRSNHRTNMDIAQRQKETCEKEVQELLASIEERKREFYMMDEEDKKKIEELKLGIAIEREKIESDLKKLSDLEKAYQKELAGYNQNDPNHPIDGDVAAGGQKTETEGTDGKPGSTDPGAGSKEGSGLARQQSIKPTLQRGNTKTSLQSPTKPKPSGGTSKPKPDGSAAPKPAKPSSSKDPKPAASKPTASKPTVAPSNAKPAANKPKN